MQNMTIAQFGALKAGATSVANALKGIESIVDTFVGAKYSEEVNNVKYAGRSAVTDYLNSILETLKNVFATINEDVQIVNNTNLAFVDEVETFNVAAGTLTQGLLDTISLYLSDDTATEDSVITALQNAENTLKELSTTAFTARMKVVTLAGSQDQVINQIVETALEGAQQNMINLKEEEAKLTLAPVSDSASILADAQSMYQMIEDAVNSLTTDLKTAFPGFETTKLNPLTNEVRSNFRKLENVMANAKALFEKMKNAIGQLEQREKELLRNQIESLMEKITRGNEKLQTLKGKATELKTKAEKMIEDEAIDCAKYLGIILNGEEAIITFCSDGEYEFKTAQKIVTLVDDDSYIETIARLEEILAKISGGSVKTSKPKSFFKWTFKNSKTKPLQGFVQQVNVTLQGMNKALGKISRKLNKITTFQEFCGFIAVVPPRIFRKMPLSDKVNRAIFGFMILLGVSVGALGSGVTASMVAPGQWIAIIGIPILWYFLIIGIDRIMILAADSISAKELNKEKVEPNSFGELVFASISSTKNWIFIARLLIIFATGYLNTESVQMIFFKQEINNNLADMKNEKVRDINHIREKSIDSLNMTRKEAYKPVEAAMKNLNGTLATKIQAVDAMQQQLLLERQQASDELKGDIGVHGKGDGPYFKSLLAKISTDSASLESFKAEVESLRLSLPEASALENAKAEYKLISDRLDVQIKEISDEADVHVKNVRSHNPGLAERYIALGRVYAGGNLVAIMLLLLFLALEMMPMIGKIFIGNDWYVVYLAEGKAYEAQQSELRRLEAKGIFTENEKRHKLKILGEEKKFYTKAAADEKIIQTHKIDMAKNQATFHASMEAYSTN